MDQCLALRTFQVTGHHCGRLLLSCDISFAALCTLEVDDVFCLGLVDHVREYARGTGQFLGANMVKGIRTGSMNHAAKKKEVADQGRPPFTGGGALECLGV